MLHLHRAARASDLIGMLGDLLQTPAPGADPFAPEVVAVPTRGIERWISQELAQRLGTGEAGPVGRDGVCANIVFPFPRNLVTAALASVELLDTTEVTGGIGDDGGLARARRRVIDPWEPERLQWTLLDVVRRWDELAIARTTPRSELGAFGAAVVDGARPVAAVAHAASLFDRYAAHRPAMLGAWSAGHDLDGVGASIRPSQAWQPRLWRAAREVLGKSPAELLADAVLRLERANELIDLPSRLAVFGLTAMPTMWMTVLKAVAHNPSHDVHLFLAHPSPALWERIETFVGVEATMVPRVDDLTADQVANPLLASWGRDARELQLVLGPVSDHQAATDEHVDVELPPDADLTLLQRVQADVLADRPLPIDGPARRHRLAPDDRSIRIHGCVGRRRQVEVLRDDLLHLFHADPTLEPRDVIVMCPDVETYAPLVDAAFRAAPLVDVAVGDDAVALPDLRIRLADRSLQATVPLLQTVDDILQLPVGRCEASWLIEFASRGPVRARFRFSDDDLDTLRDWADHLLVKWGLDAEQRDARGVPGVAQNTWAVASERLLVGLATGDVGNALVAGVAPHADVDGRDLDLAGRLAELLSRLGRAARDLTDERPVESWLDALHHHVTELTLLTAELADQAVTLDRVLAALRDEAAGSRHPVSREDLAGHLRLRLAGRPSRANHRTGDLTVCTLVPMRSVPHRVVALLGLDDDVFPRQATAPADDLIAADPVVGDRDPRSEDRQLLLDAVLSAQEHLIVTYRDRSETARTTLPPSTPLAELLDVLAATLEPQGVDGGVSLDEDGVPVLPASVRLRHPLRLEDPRNFRPGGLGRGPGLEDVPFGHDPAALRVARAEARPHVPPRLELPPLDALPQVLDLGDLIRILTNPIQQLCIQRGVRLTREEEERRDEALQYDLDGLQAWGVKVPLLRAVLDDDLDRAMDRARRTGELPPGQLGERHLQDAADVARALVHYTDRLTPSWRAAPGELLDIDIPVALEDDRGAQIRVVGRLTDVRRFAWGRALVRVGVSRIKPKDDVAMWATLLAAATQTEGEVGRAMLVGSDSLWDGQTRTATPGVIGHRFLVEDARSQFEDLVRCAVHMLDKPVFLPAATAFAWLETAHAAKRVDRARRAYDGKGWGDADVYNDLFVAPFGFATLLGFGAPPTMDDPVFDQDEPTAFGRWARRVHGPLLEARLVRDFHAVSDLVTWADDTDRTPSTASAGGPA